ncbi:hypothetical protein GQ55_1G167200 [Panicum hallii var. hallii]|uniref:Uncharacterized protein n=1 Tax=Panicum hallii var. hallii TaxID=1504633 RepID=A0A2T7F5T1_9POAL|nr:hypothetical protein GQ55_1G167200 [Panicum hallii var. hallii]
MRSGQPAGADATRRGRPGARAASPAPPLPAAAGPEARPRRFSPQPARRQARPRRSSPRPAEGARVGSRRRPPSSLATATPGWCSWTRRTLRPTRCWPARREQDAAHQAAGQHAVAQRAASAVVGEDRQARELVHVPEDAVLKQIQEAAIPMNLMLSIGHATHIKAESAAGSTRAAAGDDRRSTRPRMWPGGPAIAGFTARGPAASTPAGRTTATWR